MAVAVCTSAGEVSPERRGSVQVRVPVGHGPATSMDHYVSEMIKCADSAARKGVEVFHDATAELVEWLRTTWRTYDGYIDRADRTIKPTLRTICIDKLSAPSMEILYVDFRCCHSGATVGR
ncbi:hypothetical protein ACQPWY_25875 [Pseudonocardia xinjiangensis]|uniref:hypothetical protein n=1 Tax=Pseudonocardia xinjiangensis TaxID=75289 RepID=UPI003D8F7ABB